MSRVAKLKAYARNHWPTFLAVATLVYLVGVLFSPVLGYRFTDYDVPEQLLASPHGPGLSMANLKYYLTTPCVTSYYPVRSLSYALDYELWGLTPAGFKLTNGLLHLANVLLVFWLMLRLTRPPAESTGTPASAREVCVAAFSAGLFAVHPVVVEPVVWVAGREELLMTLGALGCVHFYLGARRMSADGDKGRRASVCYIAAATCCVAACLSNAVGAVIPLLIVTLDILVLPRPSLRSILRSTCVFWIIGAVTIVAKRSAADGTLSQTAGNVGVFTFDRLILILNVHWLNVRTLIWPKDLAMEYPDVAPQSLSEAGVLLGGLALVGAGITLWMLRRKKLMLFGLLWYGIALGPTSQIMPHHIDRADRFLYLPLIGLVLVASVGLVALTGHITRRKLVLTTVTGTLCLLLLYALSVGQVRTWQDSLSMWRNCLRVDPHNGKVHGGLADNLVKIGEYDKAVDHYIQSLLLDPSDMHSLKKFALLRATCPEQEMRDYGQAIALAQRACELQTDTDPGPTMILAETYAQAGLVEEAMNATERAIRLAELHGKPELAEQLRLQLERFASESATGNAP